MHDEVPIAATAGAGAETVGTDGFPVTLPGTTPGLTPTAPASLLFNLLIFQTETWESNELMDLEELKKIQAIYDLSKEILFFGCDQVEERSCLRNLKQVILSLTIMKRISRTSHVMMNLESSSLLEMPCLIEEGIWIKRLDDMCLDIYAKQLFFTKSLNKHMANQHAD